MTLDIIHIFSYKDVSHMIQLDEEIIFKASFSLHGTILPNNKVMHIIGFSLRNQTLKLIHVCSSNPGTDTASLLVQKYH